MDVKGEKIMTNEDKIENAMDMIIEHGGHSGEHHKAWCLDQVFRILAGDKYDLIVRVTNY